MAINTYDLGDKVRISGQFTDADGTAFDPAAVFVKVKDPSGNVGTYTYGEDEELIKDAAGSYHLDVDADEAGTWHWQMTATGTGQAAAEDAFYVKASVF